MTVTTRLHISNGDLTIASVQDVEPILERNKALQGEPQRGDFRHIGTIPNIVLLKWMNDDPGLNVLKMSSEEFGQFIKRKLADPDWRHLRTS